jgi:hypothetical protein
MTDLRWPYVPSATGASQPVVPALERLFGMIGLTLPMLRWVSILLAVAGAGGPIAHLIEMPNKLGLDGGLWLVTQLWLYKGWVWFFGPIQLAALLSCVPLAACRTLNTPALWATLAAFVSYAGMLGILVAVLHPIDVEIGQWEPITLPRDWPSYRLRWELAQAMVALLSFLGIAALLQGWKLDRRR